ncbi:aldo/keto reductase [Clostridium aceticum]|uniref:Aldo/keto reductase n=1 Tax=Clostridium aceticum TaxID=84022 RepID=A0A0D8I9S1_9CLOT|nr:aldo/keto reductase [Clostridium aceticum]AKL96024.1 aldo/keto reductase [Clostridium aceticum]KJF27040.1 aldo/keto reductase [Clostridium aceticum]
MEKRRLGKTNLNISVIGFGGIPLQRLEDEEAIKLIELAAERGINFIDSARAYGRSEELIGKGIKGNREHWILATKTMARDYESMKKEVEVSLNNFQVKTIDLYQLHNVKTIEDYENVMSENGAYKALVEAKMEGKVKEIGISSHSLEIIEKVVETDDFATIQFPYSAVERQAEAVFKRAAERDIGVIVMKPLSGGALNNGNLALRFILENKSVSVVIPGIDNAQQVYENSEVGIAYKPLSDDERKTLTEIADKLGLTFCRRCGYCLPCPQKIDIPTQFLLSGYYTRYDLQDWALDRYGTLPAKASDCLDCGACEPKCPYDLPIRDMLREVVGNLEGKK